jgi:tetratricopeptide (TPR) repeat protein
LLAAGLVCAFALSGAPARAQQVDPRETQAQIECLAGRYQAGVDLLARMFAETQNANYIYNQGRCYEQNGKLDEAILRFREFLLKAKDLSADVKAEANGHIAACQAMRTEREGRAPGAVPVPPPAPATVPVPPPPATPTPPPAAPTLPPAPPPAAAQPVAPATVAPAPTAATAAPTPAVETALGQPSSGGRGASLRTVGIVTGSMGAAALIAGVIFSVETHSISNDVTSDAANRSYSRTTADRGKLFADLQWVGYGVGAAALGCGVVLYYLGYRTGQSPASDSVSLAPVLLPGGTGAVVQGSF